MIADGVIPSNKERGYILRRLIRRIIKYAYLNLGINKSFISTIAQEVILTYSSVDQYDQLIKQEHHVYKILHDEEDKFWKLFIHGLEMADKLMRKKIELTGQNAFNLFQSYGFPLEMTMEYFIDNKAKISLNIIKEYFIEATKHQQLSRTTSSGKFKGGLSDQSEQTIKYHTTTHLLHQALFDTLGDSIRQEGSNITGERLRFDFYSVNKPTPEQIKEVEKNINGKIKEKLPVSFRIVPKEEAIKLNAKSFFREKYPDMVKVYFIENYSKEFCGGPHVKNTSEIGRTEIYKFEKIGSNLYRIYAK
jgi:alanyl-tRNA synthetase